MPSLLPPVSSSMHTSKLSKWPTDFPYLYCPRYTMWGSSSPSSPSSLCIYVISSISFWSWVCVLFLTRFFKTSPLLTESVHGILSRVILLCLAGQKANVKWSRPSHVYSRVLHFKLNQYGRAIDKSNCSLRFKNDVEKYLLKSEAIFERQHGLFRKYPAIYNHRKNNLDRVKDSLNYQILWKARSYIETNLVSSARKNGFCYFALNSVGGLTNILCRLLSDLSAPIEWSYMVIS